MDPNWQWVAWPVRISVEHYTHVVFIFSKIYNPFTHTAKSLSWLLVNRHQSPEGQLQHTQSPDNPSSHIVDRRILNTSVRQRFVAEEHIDEDQEHQTRCHNGPADAPIEAGLHIQHELNVAADALHTINPAHCQQFCNGQDQGYKSAAIKVDEIQYELSARSHVHQATEESNYRSTHGQQPVGQMGESILNHIHHSRSHSNIRSNAQDQEHEEEQNGEQLGKVLEFGNGLWIGNER